MPDQPGDTYFMSVMIEWSPLPVACMKCCFPQYRLVANEPNDNMCLLYEEACSMLIRHCIFGEIQ